MYTPEAENGDSLSSTTWKSDQATAMVEPGVASRCSVVSSLASAPVFAMTGSARPSTGLSVAVRRDIIVTSEWWLSASVHLWSHLGSRIRPGVGVEDLIVDQPRIAEAHRH